MTTNLRVTIIQTNIIWLDIDANLQRYSEILTKIKDAPDIIIFPEMFTTGFLTEPSQASEEPGGKSFQWMLEQARKYECVIAGSIVIKEQERYYNRFIWMKPDGTFNYYNKRHLFRMANEHEKYTAGTSKLIVEYKNWFLRPLICYDLRFPVWSRNRQDYDILLYVANWPESRKFQWQALLTARAIENQCYVIGVNRVGMDGNNFSYSGNSLIINPLGNIIADAGANTESIITVNMSYTELMRLRENFPVSLDADEFEILI